VVYEILFPSPCFFCVLKISVKYQDYNEEGSKHGIRGVPVGELKKESTIDEISISLTVVSQED